MESRLNGDFIQLPAHPLTSIHPSMDPDMAALMGFSSFQPVQQPQQQHQHQHQTNKVTLPLCLSCSLRLLTLLSRGSEPTETLHQPAVLTLKTALLEEAESPEAMEEEEREEVEAEEVAFKHMASPKV